MYVKFVTSLSYVENTCEKEILLNSIILLTDRTESTRIEI